MFNINLWARDNIRKMKPYSCARSEFSGEASVYLDANENPFNSDYNRYPDPLQWKLKERISQIKQIAVNRIFLGNGSDEPIDLVVRVSCVPGVHNIVAMDPTSGMYVVAAETNDVEYRKVPLNERFDIQASEILAATDENTRLIFLCSPNNPTGNTLDFHEIETILREFSGVVILDEAYIDFSSKGSFVSRLDEFRNLVVFQTLSKAWGMAGIRLGMAFASEEIILLLNKIKYPYNINVLSQRTAFEGLGQLARHDEWVKNILSERYRLAEMLRSLPLIQQIYPSEANFLLVRVEDPNGVYQYLVNQGIIVRNRNTVTLCAGCIRITVGTKQENDMLVKTLKDLC